MNSNHVKTTPTVKEIGLQKTFFAEASFMGGTSVKYCSVKSKEITELSSEMYEWNDPIQLDIIFDERPKVHLLKQLNWFTEDTSIQPRLMYIPSEYDGSTIIVKRGDLVYVPNPLNLEEDNIFQVSEVRTELVSLFWLCNVVPFRTQSSCREEPTANHKWLDT